uniref:Si:dkey-174m14.3 n=1 Tax=Neogobius melanostomus TaxID=47308 RepID=A0A8C6TV02_9GOBI
SPLERPEEDCLMYCFFQSQHHDDEKRALSREIIVLNNRLVEAKLTIEKLQEDNDMYRKDCTLAAQLLQCRAELDELPADFQERMTLHMEEEPALYADPVPSSLMGGVLDKPDDGCSSLSQGSRSPSPPSPPTQEHTFILESIGGPGGRLGLRAAYKSDLYSSDTALYCPDERNRERRPSMDLHGQKKMVYGPQISTDSQSNPEEGSMGLTQGFSQEHFSKFPPLLGTGSSSYSSFSGGGSEDKAPGPPSSGASSPRHHSLYMEWRDAAEYHDHKSESSWDGDADSPGVFSNPPSFHRTMSSCFSEPYEPLPPSSSPSVAYGDSRRGSTLAPEEEELICRWRQLSVEDLHSYRSPGRASPYSFSEQHFSVRPAKIRLGPMYSSFQEGADYYRLHQQGGAVMDQAWAGAAAAGSQDLSPGMSELQGPGGVGAGAMHSLPPQGSPQSPPAAPPPPPPPYATKFGSLGLTRKDSLTKAQLYGTLLN